MAKTTKSKPETNKTTKEDKTMKLEKGTKRNVRWLSNSGAMIESWHNIVTQIECEAGVFRFVDNKGKEVVISGGSVLIQETE